MSKQSIRQLFERHGFWLFIILALLFRLAYLAAYSQTPDWELLTVDNYYHHHWARSIADGNIIGDTTYFRAPLYVWLLGLLYSIFGSSWWVARVFGALIGSFAAGTTWLIGRRFFSTGIAAIAAAVHCCYAVLVYHDGELLTDSLFTFLFEIALFISLRWFQDKNLRTGIAAGALLGLSALARPTSLVVVPVILLFAILHFDKGRPLIRQASLFMCGLLLVVSATFLRNLVVADDPVMIASQGGINFYIGNNEDSDGVSASMPPPLGNTWQMAEVKYLAEEASGRSLKPGEISGYWFDRGTDWILDHKSEFIVRFFKKCYWMIADFEIPNQRDVTALLDRLPFPFHNPLSFGVLFAFSLWGIVTSWRSNYSVRFLSAVILLFIAASALFFVNTRFRLPTLPIFFLLAGTGVVSLLQLLHARSSRAIFALLIIAAGVFISFGKLVLLPHQPNVQALRAETSFYLNEGNIDEAITSARRAVMFDDTAMNSHLLLGIAHLRAGNSDSAIYHLRIETERQPGNEKGFVNLASALLAAGDTADALIAARQGIRLAPYDVTANQLLIRATASDSTVSDQLFRTIADSALERTGADLFLAADIGAALTARRSYVEAESSLMQALTAPPPPIETNDAAFERIFTHSPENMRLQRAQLHFQLGYIKGIIQDFGASIRQNKLAIELDPNLREAYSNLISGYLSQQEHTLADSVLRQATSRFPDDPRFSQRRLP